MKFKTLKEAMEKLRDPVTRYCISLYRGIGNRDTVFVCSPYRGPRKEENQKQAEIACKILAVNGFRPLAPHVYFTRFLKDEIFEERKIGQELGLQWIKQSGCMLVIGNEITEGMAAEIARAREEGLLIMHVKEIRGVERDGKDEDKEKENASATDAAAGGGHSAGTEQLASVERPRRAGSTLAGRMQHELDAESHDIFQTQDDRTARSTQGRHSG